MSSSGLIVKDPFWKKLGKVDDVVLKHGVHVYCKVLGSKWKGNKLNFGESKMHCT